MTAEASQRSAMKQEYVQRRRETTKKDYEEEHEQQHRLGAIAIKDTELEKQVSTMISEIDEVLEENAHE